MSELAVQQITQELSKTSVKDSGISFKGKSLVLNSEKDCDEVVKAINTCKNLQFLNLEGNTLGVDASKAISKALETKKELKRALWMDMFTGRMKEEIPRALEHLGNGLALSGAQLTELDLSDNAFGPIGVKSLAGLLSSKACYQLQVLKLNNNGLGSSGGKMLADALLQCHKNSKNEGKVFALRLFTAGRNRLENEGAIELAKVFDTLGTLEEIVMPQNGIYHQGIKALSESLQNNKNLKVLDFNDNTITKKGAKHIVKALPYLQQLKVLNLGDCLLRTGGVTLIANALADHHEQLEELHLGCNDIKSDGGLAVVKAMTNKNKLKQLNMNGNLFGTSGRKLLKEDLERSKKIHTLSELDDDLSCDEDDVSEDSDENDVNEDSDENEVNEDSDEENNEPEDEEEENQDQKEAKKNGFSPHIENNSEKFCSADSNHHKNSSLDILCQSLGGLSMKAVPIGPLKIFLENPTADNFLNLKEDDIFEFIRKNQDSSVDFYVETLLPLVVKISSVSCCSNPEVTKLSSQVSSKLYKDLFTWASAKNQLSTVNNVLFVHLGLIKSENKSFKINWDVRGSLSALRAALSEGSVPPATEDILKCFLEKDAQRQCIENITVG